MIVQQHSVKSSMDEKCVEKRSKYNKIINYLMLLLVVSYILSIAPLREQ